MSVMAEAFNELGQDIIPEIAATVFPDLMDIVNTTRTAGTAGGRVKNEVTDYPNVPITYAPQSKHLDKGTLSNELVSQARYTLTFPSYQADGTRIDLDPVNHRLIVLARGLEPQKTFRIIAVQDASGVVYKADCVKEN